MQKESSVERNVPGPHIVRLFFPLHEILWLGDSLLFFKTFFFFFLLLFFAAKLLLSLFF